ncbi:hypothetical protein OIU78_013241 [Salix suchowensis]|nr:hypothetical protein OIU78_013241 [Salix suchowensis]
MERKQLFHVSSSSFSLKKIKNPNKRNECECQQAGGEEFAGSHPLFSERPFLIKKPKPSSSGTGSIVVASRNPGRVLRELNLFDENSSEGGAWLKEMKSDSTGTFSLTDFKLFLKKPTEGPQQMIQVVLNNATVETDNPDLRDRAYIYWRLLSTDPEAAKDIVLAEKPVISDDSNLLDSSLLDELIANIATYIVIWSEAGYPESSAQFGCLWFCFRICPAGPPSSLLQVAVKNNQQPVWYFNDKISLHVFFTEDGRMERGSFLELTSNSNQGAQVFYGTTLTGSTTDGADGDGVVESAALSQ